MRLHAPVLLLLLSLAVAPSVSAEGPRRVRVELGRAVTLGALLEAGLDVTQARDGAWVDVLEWPGDAARLEALGARTRVLDAEPGRTAAARGRSPPPAARDARHSCRPSAPAASRASGRSTR